MPGLQSSLEGVFVQFVQVSEQMERMNSLPHIDRALIGDPVAQCFDISFRPVFEDQARGGIAPPAVWLSQKQAWRFLDQVLERQFPPFPLARSHPPNAAMLRAGAPRVLVAKLFRNIAGMLNPLAIEIHDVERSVRASGEINRVKPRVGGGQKFLPLFDSPGNKAGPGRFENAPM